MKRTMAQSLARVLKGKVRDLSKTIVRRKNMSEASFSLSWRSYTAQSSALAVPTVHEVATAAGIGTMKPTAFEVGELEDNNDDVPLIPVARTTPNSIDARWVDQGTRVKVDLAKLLAVRPFPIPRNTRAEIPVSAQAVSGLGPCLILHFGQASFEPIEEAPKKPAKEQKAETAQNASAKAAPAAAAPEPATEVKAKAEPEPEPKS